MPAQSSHSFVFDDFKNVLIEKFSEVFTCDAHVYVIVDLNGYTDAVALSDTEAAGKHYLVFDVMFSNGFLKKLNDILRALEVARRANTNLNEHHLLIPSQELPW